MGIKFLPQTAKGARASWWCNMHKPGFLFTDVFYQINLLDTKKMPYLLSDRNNLVTDMNS